jgi:exosortase A
VATVVGTASEEHRADPSVLESLGHGSERHSRAWRQHILAWAVLVAAILIGLWPSAVSLVTVWLTSETFQHCLLIGPIIVWLVWQRRDELLKIPPKPFLPGLFGVAACALVWLPARLGDVAILQHAALVAMVQFSVLTVFGVRVVRALVFPLFFMIFLVPWGKELIKPMQDITTDLSVFMLNVVGIKSVVDGVFITTLDSLGIPHGYFEVAEACSGVRFLIATYALGALCANLMFRKGWRLYTFLGLTLIVPIIANGIRAFGIIVIAYVTDNEVAVGVDHIIYGFFFLAVVTIILLLIARAMSDKPVDELPLDAEKEGLTLGETGHAKARMIAAVAGALIVVAAPAYAAIVNSRDPDVRVSALVAPEITGWRQDMFFGAPWRPHYANADATLFQTYRKGADAVEVFIAVYNKQDTDAEMVSYGNSLLGEYSELERMEWSWAANLPGDITLAGRAERATAQQIRGPQSANRDVWQWYLVNGKIVATPLEAKLEAMWAKLFGGPLQAATIIVSAERVDGSIAATPAMQAFLEQFGPIEVALPKLLADSSARAQE